jgi:hypothetical protein
MWKVRVYSADLLPDMSFDKGVEILRRLEFIVLGGARMRKWRLGIIRVNTERNYCPFLVLCF